MQNLPIRNLSIDPENDNVLKFDIQSSQEKKDTSKNAKTEKLTYHFKYDITSKKLTFSTKDEDAKYPEWANVSPDGLVGVYMRNSNLFYMDTLNMRKAAKDPKDSTLVEHRITSDGFKDFSYASGNYAGNTEADTTKRVFPFDLAWSPDSKHFAVTRKGFLGNQLAQLSAPDIGNIQIPDAGRTGTAGTPVYLRRE